MCIYFHIWKRNERFSSKLHTRQALHLGLLRLVFLQQSCPQRVSEVKEEEGLRKDCFPDVFLVYTVEALHRQIASGFLKRSALSYSVFFKCRYAHTSFPCSTRKTALVRMLLILSHGHILLNVYLDKHRRKFQE